MPIYSGKGYLFSNYYRVEVPMINYLIGYILIVSKNLYDISYGSFNNTGNNLIKAIHI